MITVCQSETISVIRGQFVKLYEQELERRKEYQALPESVRGQVERIGGDRQLIE